MTHLATDAAIDFHRNAAIDASFQIAYPTISQMRAEETANLLSLDSMAKDWDLVSLIEAMPADDLQAAMALLHKQVARELVDQGDGA